MKTNRIVILIITLIIIGFIAWYFSNIIAYILISAALSFMGLPLVKILDSIKIRNIKIPHTLSTVVALIAMIAIIVTLFRVLVPVVAHQATSLSNIDYAAITESLDIPSGKLEKTLLDYGLIKEKFLLTINHKLFDIVNAIDFDKIIGGFIDFAGSFFIGIFSVIFLTFFFLRDDKLFFSGVMAFVPEKYENDTIIILNESKRLLSRYFIGLCLEILIMMALISAGGYFLGLKNWLLIGVIGGLFNVIPYLGPIIGATIGAILVAATNLNPDFYSETISLMLGILAVFAGANLIDNFVLQPLIYSTSVKAHPIEIFLVIIMAGTLAGVTGMILAIPVYTLFRIIARQFFSRVKLVKKITERM